MGNAQSTQDPLEDGEHGGSHGDGSSSSSSTQQRRAGEKAVFNPMDRGGRPPTHEQQRQRQQHASAGARAGDGDPRQPRVLVDISGADAGDHNYAVWIEQRPPASRQRSAVATAEAVEGGVLSVSGTLQALGGVLITILTIQKLVEEVRAIRAIRRGARGGGGWGGGPDGGNAADPRDDGGGPPPEQRLLPPVGAEAALGEGQGGGSGGGAAAADTWAGISGLREVKMLLQEATVMPLLRPDLFGGVREPPRGVLLYGPPGTGKTMLARAVAAESGAAFIPVTGSSILSKWYGESEGNVRRLFEEARRRAPCVIFIDEVDSLLGRRAGGGDDGPGGAGEASRRVTNEFLSYIDGIHTAAAGPEAGPAAAGAALGRGAPAAAAAAAVAGASASRVVVIAATNAPWDLDEAALSRFSARVLVPLPDANARAHIMARAMRGVACDLSDADWRRAAAASAGYSGRDLVQVCREASMRPLRELWGNRVLAGGGAPRDAQRHRQMVAAVSAALRRGVGRRKMRRELEKWKKAEGSAPWCHVDAIMREAEQQNGGTAAGGGPQAAGGGKKQRCEDRGDQGQPEGDGDDKEQQQQQQQPCADPGGCSHGSAGGGSGGPRSSRRSGREGGESSGAESGGDVAAPEDKDTWTVEELLALPADSLRPVAPSDFEAALQSISPTECGLAPKFEEWTARYGAGAGTKRREDAWRAMPMYL